MKYIYLKGLLNKKGRNLYLIISIILLSVLGIILAYRGILKDEYDTAKENEINRILTFDYDTINLDNYREYIETESCSDKRCTITFTHYEAKNKFIEENKDITIVETTLYFYTNELSLIKTLNIVSIILIICLILIVVLFMFNYINKCTNNITLYQVLGLSKKKCCLCINLYFSIINIIYLCLFHVILIITSSFILSNFIILIGLVVFISILNIVLTNTFIIRKISVKSIKALS